MKTPEENPAFDWLQAELQFAGTSQAENLDTPELKEKFADGVAAELDNITLTSPLATIYETTGELNDITNEKLGNKFKSWGELEHDSEGDYLSTVSVQAQDHPELFAKHHLENVKSVYISRQLYHGYPGRHVLLALAVPEDEEDYDDAGGRIEFAIFDHPQPDPIRQALFEVGDPVDFHDYFSEDVKRSIKVSQEDTYRTYTRQNSELTAIDQAMLLDAIALTKEAGAQASAVENKKHA